VHDLATHYGVQTESIDQEPHRSVVLFRRDFPPARIPAPLLSEAARQPVQTGSSGGGGASSGAAPGPQTTNSIDGWD
jgi:hypothetical protein